jgi:hypothetical protein
MGSLIRNLSIGAFCEAECVVAKMGSVPAYRDTCESRDRCGWSMLRCAKLYQGSARALIIGKARRFPLKTAGLSRDSVVSQRCSSTSGGFIANGMIQASMPQIMSVMQSKCVRSSAFSLIAVSRRSLSSSQSAHTNSKDPEVVGEMLQNVSLENVIESASLDPVPSGWSPAALAEYGIVAIHDSFGLPWCLSIAGITVVLRALLFPLVVYQVNGCGALRSATTSFLCGFD